MKIIVPGTVLTQRMGMGLSAERSAQAIGRRNLGLVIAPGARAHRRRGHA